MRTEFDLIVDPIPLTTVLTPLEECDDDSDGLTEFTLTDKDTEALNGQTGLSVSYYLTQSDAELVLRRLDLYILMQLLMLSKFGFDLQILPQVALV